MKIYLFFLSINVTFLMAYNKPHLVMPIKKS